MKSSARTVSEYLASLPPERRAVLAAVRETILAHLREGYGERMQFGIIGYAVPHSLHPAGYHCNPKEPLPYATLGAQKNHLALHLMAVYGDPETERWFRAAWQATGRKLDMGKACVRFRKLEDLPLEAIGQAIARVPVASYVARIQALLSRPRPGRPRQAA